MEILGKSGISQIERSFLIVPRDRGGEASELKGHETQNLDDPLCPCSLQGLPLQLQVKAVT